MSTFNAVIAGGAYVKIMADNSGLEKGLNQAQSKLKRFASGISVGETTHKPCNSFLNESAIQKPQEPEAISRKTKRPAEQTEEAIVFYFYGNGSAALSSAGQNRQRSGEFSDRGNPAYPVQQIRGIFRTSRCRTLPPADVLILTRLQMAKPAAHLSLSR